MLEFMDYVQNAFYDASQWSKENSYSSLTATARALLDFHTPRGLRFNVSSLSSPNFATSYSLGSIGVVDGALSYLYSSIPLYTPSKTTDIDLHDVIHGYRQIQELRKPDEAWMWEEWQGGRRTDRGPSLFYGRMYLPQSTLEALYLRRINPTQQFKLSAVSDSRLKNGATLLALHQVDTGKYCTETLYSTDGGLVGVRGLWNFGPDPRKPTTSLDHRPEDREGRIYGRFSAGAELYYGSLNRTGGVSFGGRFATLPAHKGVPLTATLTVNPLMGNLSSTYAVKAGNGAAFCSRFDFNVYSYESELVLGCELWRKRVKISSPQERSMEAKLAWRLDEEVPDEGDGIAGVLKAKVDQHGRIGLLWEGRMKELLFSLGSSIDVGRNQQPVRTFGIEFQFSS